MRKFSNFRIGNIWEDIYINDTILLLIKSDLCERFYANFADEFYRPLLCQKYKVWFFQNESWLRENLSASYFYTLHAAAALTSDRFSDSITYGSWMAIGLAIEARRLSHNRKSGGSDYRDMLDHMGDPDGDSSSKEFPSSDSEGADLDSPP